jgi:hypothetical protein
VWNGKSAQEVIVSVVDVYGSVVKRLKTESGSQARWDLRDNSGRRLKSGIYWIQVSDGLERYSSERITVIR